MDLNLSEYVENYGDSFFKVKTIFYIVKKPENGYENICIDRKLTLHLAALGGKIPSWASRSSPGAQGGSNFGPWGGVILGPGAPGPMGCAPEHPWAHGVDATDL